MKAPDVFGGHQEFGIIGQTWWHVPVIPATWEAEAGESLEHRRWRLQTHIERVYLESGKSHPKTNFETYRKKITRTSRKNHEITYKARELDWLQSSQKQHTQLSNKGVAFSKNIRK